MTDLLFNGSKVTEVIVFSGLGLAWAYIGFMVILNKLEKNARKDLTTAK